MRTFVFLALAFAAAGGTAANGRPPLSKGSIDLATGLYVHVTEDLVLPGTPRLALQRTYLSGYRSAREFGVGATHAGEDYLVAGENLESVSLILARGSRIQFRRVQAPTAFLTGLFLHDATAGEWQGAELTSTAARWTLKKRDGTLMVFRVCDASSMCSLVQVIDRKGDTINYRRDSTGRLLKMEAGRRWIAFDYDGEGRVERARDSQKRAVQYHYDERGRLERVTDSDDSERRYGYTAEDELQSIEEPGISITNTFVNGRCVRQSSTSPGRQPDVIDVAYELDGPLVRRTRVIEAKGAWREYAWDDRKTVMSETLGRPGTSPTLVSYERDPLSRAVINLTVSCADRQGRPVRESTAVRRGEEDLLKAALVRKYCF